MHISGQQEEFSRAFVAAIVHAANFKIQPPSTPDDDSVDFSICARGKMGLIRSPRIDVQLKCQMGPVPVADFSFELKHKNYEDLSPPLSEFQIPRILLIVIVPPVPQDWIEERPDMLLLRHRAFWVCLHGAPSSANLRTDSVRIPVTNDFTRDALVAMMGRVGQKGQP